MSKFVSKINNIKKERDIDLNEKYRLIPYSFKERINKEKEDIVYYPFLKRIIYDCNISYVLNFPSYYEYSRYGEFLGENTRFYANISKRHRDRVKFEKMMIRKIFIEKTNMDADWFVNFIYKFLIGFGNIEYNYYFKNYNFKD